MPNDLALDALSLNIESHVLEILGDRDLPPRAEPKDYLLT